uniref:PHD-type domain-containing protein n=1 Tax=Steinernema glaseri TaxID=37863 RepID=A0A1I8AIS6_9BILA
MQSSDNLKQRQKTTRTEKSRLSETFVAACTMSEETDGDLPKEIVSAEASNDSFATTATEIPPSEDTNLEPETEEGGETADDIEDDEIDEEDEEDEQEDEDEDEDNDDEPEEDTAGEEEQVKEIPPVDPEQLYSSPLYAQICSFFTRFCVTLGMKPVDFDRIERMFCVFDGGKVNRDLVELHITMLRKISMKGARMDKWELFLRKFCTMTPSLEDETRQLERLGYIELPLETKLTILNTLCCTQFDKNIKLRENVFNTYNAYELRMLPIGCDKNGLNYYYQQDSSLNVRLYTEEPDDDAGCTWKIVVRSVPELCRLINALKRKDFGVVEEENEGDTVKKEASEENGPTLDDPIPMPVIPEGSDLKAAFTKSCKRGMFVDVYQDDSVLNRRKNDKLEKKRLKAEGKFPSVEPKPEPMEEDEEEKQIKKEEKDEIEPEKELSGTPKEATPVLDEDSLLGLEDSERRILPRRSARSCALKVLTASARKAPKPKTDTPKKAEIPSEDEQDDNDDEFEDDGSDELRSSDDEFMPKSARRKLRKRAAPANGETPKKVVKKKKKQTMVFEESDESDVEEQEQKERKKATDKSLCLKCKKANKPEVLLLCDMCDDACHTFCLRPPLWYVPDDDWFCPKCNHQMLVDKLTFVYHLLREELVKKEEEDRRKAIAAEKLKREMEYIGISLNNVIPSRSGVSKAPAKVKSESEEESDVPDDGQRKSKRKALKRVMRQKTSRPSPSFYGPIVTIAEGRSRRNVTKVDYKFGAYDDLIQEAMEDIDETLPKKQAIAEAGADVRPQGGVGNKDMANIINAEKKRKAEAAEQHQEEEEEEHKPPQPKKPKAHHRKLTDLNDDDASESESDEYQASEGSVKAAEDDSDEYVPSDEARGLRGGRMVRSRSMDDFVVSDSDSDYNPSSKKKKGKKKTTPKKKKGKKSRRRYELSSDEETEEDEEEPEYMSEASSSDDNRKKKRKAAQSKWGPKPSSSEEEELEVEDMEEDVERTATGRPLRRAVKAKTIASDEEEEVEDEEEAEESPKKEQRPVGALTRINRRKSDEEDFQPEEEEEDEEEDEEEIEAEASMVKIKRISDALPDPVKVNENVKNVQEPAKVEATLEKKSEKAPVPKPAAPVVPVPTEKVANQRPPVSEPSKLQKPAQGQPARPQPQNGSGPPAVTEQQAPPPPKPAPVRRSSAGMIRPPAVSTPPTSFAAKPPVSHPQSFNIPPSTSAGAFAPPPHGAPMPRHPYAPPMHHMPFPGYYPQHPGVRYAVPQPQQYMPVHTSYGGPPPQEASWYAHQAPAPVDIYSNTYRPLQAQGPPKMEDPNGGQAGGNTGGSADSESLGHALAGAMHSDLM